MAVWWSAELLVSLCTSDNNVDPDPEHLGARGDQVEAVAVRLDAEREVRHGTAHRPQVIKKHVDDVAERHRVSGPAAGGRVRPAAVPAERPVRPVEHEPASVPRVQHAATGHLGQRALTRRRRELDRGRVVLQAVSRGLDELTQVEGRVAHGQVARQRSTLAHTYTHHGRQILEHDSDVPRISLGGYKCN